MMGYYTVSELKGMVDHAEYEVQLLQSYPTNAITTFLKLETSRRLEEIHEKIRRINVCLGVNKILKSNIEQYRMVPEMCESIAVLRNIAYHYCQVKQF